MTSETEMFKRKSFFLIFTYAPLGLGHLRVTDALYHGLPAGSSPILLSSQDQSINVFYRFMSIHPLMTMLMETAEKGFMETISAFFYRRIFRSNAKLLQRQLETILDQRIEPPDTVLIVASHFGLAHQVAEIKHKLAAKRHLRIILVVQVTDDSPQQIWYVPGSDLTFVPSHKTKEALQLFGEKAGFAKIPILVNPYPVSPLLRKNLSAYKYQQRIKQLTDNEEIKLQIMIPISGSAVGLNFFTEFIDSLHLISPHILFHIVTKSAGYTKRFIYDMLSRPSIQLHTAFTDRLALDIYDDVYTRNVIAIEVTKPSEQAFKVLLTPKHVGGVILLFSKPIGRQEYDNLDFMRRHNLIPSLHQHQIMWERSEQNSKLISVEDREILSHAKKWRGIQLPDNPQESARFLKWCIREEIFSQMMHYGEDLPDQRNGEVSPDGVKLFWEKVAYNLLSS